MTFIRCGMAETSCRCAAEQIPYVEHPVLYGILRNGVTYYIVTPNICFSSGSGHGSEMLSESGVGRQYWRVSERTVNFPESAAVASSPERLSMPINDRRRVSWSESDAALKLQAGFGIRREFLGTRGGVKVGVHGYGTSV